jgi:hypothetical protein
LETRFLDDAAAFAKSAALLAENYATEDYTEVPRRFGLAVEEGYVS